jgi:isocitrate dehydrogenase
MYWAKSLANQQKDPEIAGKFSEMYKQLAQNETKIISELNNAQGKKVDIGGYYRPVSDKAFAAMRPSKTFNAILESISK